MPDVWLDLPRRVVALVGPVGLTAPACLVISACTYQGTPHPASLGGCSGSYDASCSVSAGGGAGGGSGDSGPGGDSGNVEVFDSGVFPEDAAVCSSADFLLAARTPVCASCLAAPQNDGAPSCCALDTACAADPGCATILQCVLTCTNPGACSQTCGSGAEAQSALAYSALVTCAQYGCAPLCPVLVPLATADQ